MRRVFNTAGPCRPEKHYMLPPLERLPPSIPTLIDEEAYFVLHAPRQTGKTTSLRALARKLTEEGTYAAILLSMQRGAEIVTNPEDSLRGILNSWRELSELYFPPELWPPPWPEVSSTSLIASALVAWAMACPRPLVLFLDEIDALQGSRLISVLHQLRDGQGNRPEGFPASIALVGLRDVSEYKYASGGTTPPDPESISPFNILVESLTLNNFTLEEVGRLYRQHTEATGQVFTDEAVERAFELSQGQPWLVNALAYWMTRLEPDPAITLTAERVDEARKSLVRKRDRHLTSLAGRLRDPRVKGVLQLVFAEGEFKRIPVDDIRFAIDLGLVRQSHGGRLELANPIYREVLLEELTFAPLAMAPALHEISWMTDGQLDPDKLLEAFMDFWAQHGSALMSSAEVPELAPHIVVLAFLMRVVNHGGWVNREHPSGPGRMDVFVEHKNLRLAVELKVWRTKRADPAGEGLEQLEGYMRKLRTDLGWLIVFDRRSGQPDLSERMSLEQVKCPGGTEVSLLRA